MNLSTQTAKPQLGPTGNRPETIPDTTGHSDRPVEAGHDGPVGRYRPVTWGSACSEPAKNTYMTT